jgi:hypothetical protein
MNKPERVCTQINHTCTCIYRYKQYSTRFYSRLDAEKETSLLYRRVLNKPGDVDCMTECETWSYSYRVDGYNEDTMMTTSIADGKESGFGRIWLKMVSSKIEVSQEYKVYDFSGIVGSLGGSLGLFIGFSFLDCLVATCAKITFCPKFMFPKRTHLAKSEEIM